MIMSGKFIPEDGVEYAPVYYFIGVDMKVHCYIKEPYSDNMYAQELDMVGNLFKNKDEAKEYALIIRKILSSRNIVKIKELFNKSGVSDKPDGHWEVSEMDDMIAYKEE